MFEGRWPIWFHTQPCHRKCMMRWYKDSLPNFRVVCKFDQNHYYNVTVVIHLRLSYSVLVYGEQDFDCSWWSINCLPSPNRVNASNLGICHLFNCHPSMRPLNKSNFGSGLWGLEAQGYLSVWWITTPSGLHGNSITFIRTGLCIASYKSRLCVSFCAFLSFPVRQLQIFHFLMMSSGICWWHNEGKCWV